MKIFAIFFLSATVWLHATLPASIRTLIEEVGLPQEEIGLIVKRAGSGGKTIASLNAWKLQRPASVIKVLTTYAALLRFGFSHRIPTQVYRNGEIKNGVLYGDLVIKGFGDPSLYTEDVEEMVARLKSMGVRRITGHIVIDRSYFAVGTQNSARFDENPYSPYNAMPDAMMFNERVSTICIEPQNGSVYKALPNRDFVVTNRIRFVDKPCRKRYGWPRVKIIDKDDRPEILLEGKLSKHCRPRKICKVVSKPYIAFYYALKEAMKKAGVSAPGSLRLSKVPPAARILFIHAGKSMEEIVSETAKESNNLYARQLLLYLGARTYGAPATLYKGRKAVLETLRKYGVIGKEKAVIDNGSGLSRKALLSPAVLVRVLDNAYERFGMRWMKTLAIAGEDGTIKRRFRGTSVARRAWMKTGTLKYAKNIAGYVKSRSGTFYTVVVLINTKHGRWRAKKFEDNLLKWIVSRL